MKHRGEFPYPLPTGVCTNIRFSLHGGRVDIGQGVRHRLKERRRLQQELPLSSPTIVFREYGDWWRSRCPSTYDRKLIR